MKERKYPRNYKNYHKLFAHRIIKRQKKKNIFNKHELLLVVRANLDRHMFDHKYRKYLSVRDKNHNTVYKYKRIEV